MIPESASRTLLNNENLQNIPSRGALAYLIKRMFTAISGKYMIKADMSSHEVRVLSVAATDTVLAEAFGIKLVASRKLRIFLMENIEVDYELIDYMKNVKWKELSPDDKRKNIKKLHNKSPIMSAILDAMLAFEAADLHRVNYNMIYGKDPLAVTKSERNEFKSVIFGAIYDRAARTLAISDLYVKDVKEFTWELIRKTLKHPNSEKAREARKKYNQQIKPFVEKAQKIIDTLFGRFKISADWMLSVKQEAREKYCTVSPLGNVRHLWGLLHTQQSVQNKSIRRAANSRIQGLASDCVYSGARLFRTWIWEAKQNGFNIPVSSCNAVHDSSELECEIVYIPLVLYILEHSYTTLVHRRLRDVYGFDPFVSLEIDAEIGPHLGDTTEISFSEAAFLKSLSNGIDWQIQEKHYNLNKKEILKKVKYNWRLINQYRLKEMKKMQKGVAYAPSYEMLITPENVGKIGYRV